jgi:hypothetical protein
VRPDPGGALVDEPVGELTADALSAPVRVDDQLGRVVGGHLAVGRDATVRGIPEDVSDLAAPGPVQADDEGLREGGDPVGRGGSGGQGGDGGALVGAERADGPEGDGAQGAAVPSASARTGASAGTKR